jgi:RHS repeat-associated protein
LGNVVYAYDKSHQVTSQDKLYYDDVENTRILDDTADLGDQYGYDGAKRLVTVLRGVPTAEIGETLATNIGNGDYDDFVEYHYDKTGNRLTREIDGSNDVEYACNVVNEMTTEGGATLTYHDNGTYQESSASSKLWSYDHADHLARYDNAASLTYVWHYDALGRRIARTHDGTGLDDVRWYYDGEYDVEEVTWDGETETQTKKHVYGETIDELLEYVDVSANPDDTYYAHGDKLGSVLLLADETGAIVESYRYKEFGETDVVDGSFAKTSSVTSGVGNLKMYTARDEQEEIATFADPWYRYRARAYRADAGRFVQRDPDHYADSSSLFTYVADSPTNGVGPFGSQLLSPQEIGPGAVPLGYGPHMGFGAGLPPGTGPTLRTNHVKWGGGGAYFGPSDIGGPAIPLYAYTCPPFACGHCVCEFPVLSSATPLLQLNQLLQIVVFPGVACMFVLSPANGCQLKPCGPTEECPRGRLREVCQWQGTCTAGGNVFNTTISCVAPCPLGP